MQVSVTQKARKVDVPKIMTVMSCVAELFIFLTVFVVRAIPKQEMISDIILSTPTYATFLTLFLSIRSIASMCFLMRYREARPAWVGAGCASTILAFFGWVWLATHDNIKMHTLGVAIYLFATGVTLFIFIEIIALADANFKRWKNRVMVLMLVIDAVLAAAYISFWTSKDKISYLPEHLSYAFYVTFHGVFFYYHTPNIYTPVVGPAGEFVDKVVLCIPLVRQSTVAYA